MRITDFKHVSVFILRVNNIIKCYFILVGSKKMPGVVRYSGLELNYKRQGGFVYLITFINTFSLSDFSKSI